MNRAAGSAVPTDKQALRQRIRAGRQAIAAQRDRSADADDIASAVAALLDTLPPPICVATYRSLPTEPPTEAVAELLHTRCIRVIVPEMLPDKDLDWHDLRPDGTEGPGLGLDAIQAAELVITPALAVDYHGTRLGQGGGSYDRALARRHADVVIVAIVNDEEYAAWPLPRDAHDVPVDAVITASGGIWLIAAG